MDWENKTIGFAMCGSFCTFKKAMGVLEKLTQTGANVIPIMSEMSYNTDTRFGKAEDFRTNITNLTGNNIICCVKDAEPIGPKNLLDLLVVLPCTGNTPCKNCKRNCRHICYHGSKSSFKKSKACTFSRIHQRRTRYCR